MKNRALFIFVFLFSVTFSSFAQHSMNTSNQPDKEKLDAKKRLAIVDEIAKELKANYIFLETAEKMEDRIRTQLKNGAYDSSSAPQAFADAVHKDLREVSKDKHLGFHYDPEVVADLKRLESQDAKEAAAVKEKQLASVQEDNFGFRKVERLDGNVGYLRFDYFAFEDGAQNAATSALNFLANCDALIIDLRKNGGGHPSQIQYITSYFFESPVHLNDIYSRRDNSTENYWTLPYVPGKKMANTDIYVLTSNYSFSGAEEFTYNLKNLKRATIVGETTGGGAHPVEPIVVAAKYVLSIPFARAINPITKTNWEGTGVTPDVSVTSEEAYDVAYAMAVENLLPKAKNTEQKSKLEWIQTSLKGRRNPAKLNDSIMQSYAGIYEDRKIFFENGNLYYQRSGPRYKMLPLSETLFDLDGLPDFRLEFVVKDGKAIEVVGLYRGGHKDSSKRAG
jgi:hypothetical protein